MGHWGSGGHVGVTEHQTALLVRYDLSQERACTGSVGPESEMTYVNIEGRSQVNDNDIKSTRASG